MASIFGGDRGVDALTGALDRAAREVDAFTSATEKAKRATSEKASGDALRARNERVGSVARGALRGGLLAAGAFALRTARSSALNDDSFGNQAGADLARAASTIDPRLRNAIEPVDRAADRVASITTDIARFGGQVSREQRQRLFDVFSRQESAAQAEQQAIARLANNGVANAAAGSQSLQEVKELVRLGTQILDAIRQSPFLGGG